MHIPKELLFLPSWATASARVDDDELQIGDTVEIHGLQGGHGHDCVRERETERAS